MQRGYSIQMKYKNKTKEQNHLKVFVKTSKKKILNFFYIHLDIIFITQFKEFR